METYFVRTQHNRYGKSRSLNPYESPSRRHQEYDYVNLVAVQTTPIFRGELRIISLVTFCYRITLSFPKIAHLLK